jgi:nucleotide-binding universal stress UspA family protein
MRVTVTTRMKTILVPIDFSAITDRVCKTAVALTQALKGRVVLLHSVPAPVMVSDYGSGVMMENYAEIAEASESAGNRQLARLQSRLRRRTVTIKTVQASGPPVPFILAQAQALRADYIVMGSHGHAALYNLLVGSTAHGVLAKASCPVIIVPPAKRPAKSAPPRKKRRR